MVLAADFITSPGAAGVGALLAAIVAGGAGLLVSRHRRQEANKELAADEAKLRADQLAGRLERWWDRFTWLVSVDATTLPIERRTKIVAQLLAAARDLDDQDLVNAVEQYQWAIFDWLVAAQPSAPPSAGGE